MQDFPFAACQRDTHRTVGFLEAARDWQPLKLREKQHDVKIYSSKCFKVQMLHHVFG